MQTIKWPPPIKFIETAHGIKEFEKAFLYFCRSNNFKHEEMEYLWVMFNTFYFLNKPIKDQE